MCFSAVRGILSNTEKAKCDPELFGAAESAAKFSLPRWWSQLQQGVQVHDEVGGQTVRFKDDDSEARALHRQRSHDSVDGLGAKDGATRR